MSKRLLAIAYLSALCVVDRTAEAAFIKYEMTGQVAFAATSVPSIQVGDPWTATVYVDTAEPELVPNPGSPTSSVFYHTTGQMTIGSAVEMPYAQFRPQLSLANQTFDFLGFDYNLTGTAGVCVDGVCADSISLGFGDLSGTALHDDSLTGTFGLTVASFTNNSSLTNFSIRFSTGNPKARVVGIPASLSVTLVDALPIPIPAAVWLLGSAIGVLGYLGRSLAARTATQSRPAIPWPSCG